jgi:hypothetical protein
MAKLALTAFLGLGADMRSPLDKKENIVIGPIATNMRNRPFAKNLQTIQALTPTELPSLRAPLTTFVT